jgi:hypothetical protein
MKLSEWSPLDLGAAFVAIVVLGLFVFAFAFAELAHDKDTLQALITLLVSAVTLVVKRFYDSSAASSAKNATIAKQAELIDKALMAQPPAPAQAK